MQKGETQTESHRSQVIDRERGGEGGGEGGGG